MIGIIAFPLLFIAGSLLALPPICDLWSALRRLGRRPAASGAGGTPRLLFLVPAHDEALLITRCVHSLKAQQYPAASLRVVVLADNCSDRTAELAAAAGAEVLVRHSTDARGKAHAIAWALETIPSGDYDAMVIVDADTLVEQDFAAALARRAPLEHAVLQCYDGMSNEFESWLTCLAGLLTRNRYGLALPLKEAVGLSIPLTGDGTVLGREILIRKIWRTDSITEGWDLYTRLALQGVRTGLVNEARLYAQEARSLSQGEVQRTRWTSGRLGVLRRYYRQIVTSRALSWHQRLDLLAELTSLGPVLNTVLAITGFALVLVLSPPLEPLLAALFLAPLAQTALYSSISLARHPHPARVLKALAFLPGYVLWRVALGIRVLRKGTRKDWHRSERHEEPPLSP